MGVDFYHKWQSWCYPAFVFKAGLLKNPNFRGYFELTLYKYTVNVALRGRGQ